VAKKTAGKKNNKAANSKEKQKFLRIITVLLIICLSITAVGFACLGVARALFTKNERLALRRIELNGMSPERTKAMIKYLKLDLGEDNLFNIDIADVRKKIEKISYIKNASVYRVLPDTLKVNITQRVPLAYLFKYGSRWVIDEDAVVMSRKSCMKIKYPLPVIKDFKCITIKTGEKMSNLEQAVKLIKLTTYEFQKFKVSSVSLEDPKKITFIMIKKRRAYKVLMPRKNIKDMLQVLRYALQQKQGKHKSTIDLTYNNQVIFR
jgi:cell division septal protein FtsQ